MKSNGVSAKLLFKKAHRTIWRVLKTYTVNTRCYNRLPRQSLKPLRRSVATTRVFTTWNRCNAKRIRIIYCLCKKFWLQMLTTTTDLNYSTPWTTCVHWESYILIFTIFRIATSRTAAVNQPSCCCNEKNDILVYALRPVYSNTTQLNSIQHQRMAWPWNLG